MRSQKKWQSDPRQHLGEGSVKCLNVLTKFSLSPTARLKDNVQAGQQWMETTLPPEFENMYFTFFSDFKNITFYVFF